VDFKKALTTLESRPIGSQSNRFNSLVVLFPYSFLSLATHLGSAFVIYLGLLHTALSLRMPTARLAASQAVSKGVYVCH